MPSFPPEAVQSRTHGNANEVAVQDAFRFYREIKRYADACQRPLEPSRTLLDFGTGWGRVVRLFMKDLRGSDLYGCDPDSGRIVAARQHNPYVNFIQSRLSPPLPLRYQAFDYITSYSVFSHLNEFASKEWISELARMLKPRGMMCVTTQGSAFLDWCEQLVARVAAGETLTSPWQEALVAHFPDVEATRRRFIAGEYVFEGEPNAQYGDAVIPEEYVRSNWCDAFDLVDFVDDRDRSPQALIVLQKREP